MGVVFQSIPWILRQRKSVTWMSVQTEGAFCSFVPLLMFFWNRNWLDFFCHTKSYIVRQILLPATVLWGKESSSTCSLIGLKADWGLLSLSSNNHVILRRNGVEWKIEWRNHLIAIDGTIINTMSLQTILQPTKSEKHRPTSGAQLQKNFSYKNNPIEVPDVTLAWQQCWGEACSAHEQYFNKKIHLNSFSCIVFHSSFSAVVPYDPLSGQFFGLHLCVKTITCNKLL